MQVLRYMWAAARGALAVVLYHVAVGIGRTAFRVDPDPDKDDDASDGGPVEATGAPGGNINASDLAELAALIDARVGCPLRGARGWGEHPRAMARA